MADEVLCLTAHALVALCLIFVYVVGLVVTAWLLCRR
jgi:hypothetical protein